MEEDLSTTSKAYELNKDTNIDEKKRFAQRTPIWLHLRRFGEERLVNVTCENAGQHLLFAIAPYRRAAGARPSFQARGYPAGWIAPVGVETLRNAPKLGCIDNFRAQALSIVKIVTHGQTIWQILGNILSEKHYKCI